ncbi:MAG: hypothetical protein ACI4EX_03035 [Lachnospiraceae bacterium]
MKKWKKLRSLLAVTLSAAIVFTAVPQTAFVSNAAQAYEVTAPDEEPAAPVAEIPVADTPAVSDEDETNPATPTAPGAETPTVSDGDGTDPATPTDPTAPTDPTTPVDPEIPGEPIVDEPTVSDGDVVLDPELYQSKKLAIKAKQTTIYSGQQNVLAAQVGYEKTTSDEGLAYKVTGITLNGMDMTSYITCDTSNPEELKLSVKYSAAPGKYVITLLPVVPTGIHAEPATLTINVVSGIYRIVFDGPNVVYKAAGKAVSFQIKTYAKAYNGTTAYKPGALKWSVQYYDITAGEYVPYEGKNVTVSTTGKVTLGKDFEPEQYPELQFICQANDYEGNSTKQTYYVYITDLVSAEGTAIIADSINKCLFQNGDEVTAADLDSRYLVVTADDTITTGTTVSTLDRDLYTYKSSSKDVTINKYGQISVLNVSGRPVTLTATTLDGKTKKSITLNLKKKTFAMDELEAIVQIGFVGGIGSTINKDTPDYTYRYSGTGNDPIMLYFEIDGNQDYLDMSVSVKGGKNITSTYNKLINTILKELGGYISADEKQCVVIVPTAQVVEVTVKSGKESRVFKIENTNFSTTKNTPQKGEPKITTSGSLYKINDTQTIKIYAGKQNAGGTVYLDPDATFLFTNYGNLITSLELFDDLLESKTIDEDGYVTFTVTNIGESMKALETEAQGHKWVKIPTSLKYQMTVKDKYGNFYAPTAFTLKITNGAPKTDYKLQTSYKITKNRIPNTFYYMMWEEGEGYYDYENTWDYVYYQQLTYTGSKEPSDTMTVTGINVDLGKDLLTADELPNNLDICYDEAGSYYLAVDDYYAYDLLCAANAKIIAEGKDVTKYGKDAKLDGNIYLSYKITTKEGYVIEKTDKVKVSIVVPKSDYNRLYQKCD